MSKDLDISSALVVLSKNYNVSTDEIKRVLDNIFDNVSNKQKLENTETKKIILPFCGAIKDDCCKAVIYNHGLYTQCTKVTGYEICKLCSKLKYGRIEERIKSKIGEFINPEGKKEIPYEKFMTKMGYTIEEVKKALSHANLTYDFKETTKQSTKGRGRPKKIQIEESDSEDKEYKEDKEDKEEIDVINIKINGKNYYKTKDDVILDKLTYEVVGVLKNGSIEVIE
tara:strand:- start:505 stop:1182 length:678 start_codon:yes stop_codon:yes gene_type:complete